jgi:hypothetical protein
MNGDKVLIDFVSRTRKKFDIVDFVGDESIVFSLFPKEAIEYAISDKEKEISQKTNSDFEALKITATEYETTISNLNAENATLKTSNEELSNYKNNNEKSIHTSEVNEVFSDFEESLKDNEEYVAYKSQVETDIMAYSVDVVSDKLNAIFGKLQFSRVAKKPKEKVSASVINVDDSGVKTSRYGKYEKYVNK